jgi:hypothetical protein
MRGARHRCALGAPLDDLDHVHSGTIQEYLQEVNKQACVSGPAPIQVLSVIAIAVGGDAEAAGVLEIAGAGHANPLPAPGQEAQQGADIVKRRAAMGAHATGADWGFRYMPLLLDTAVNVRDDLGT